MTKKEKRKVGECVYCGQTRPLSEDHIPPKNLFPKPFHKDLIKIPSCDCCNRGASQDDEYFRLVLIIRNDTFPHPEATKNWPPVWRSLHRPLWPGLRKKLQKSLRKVNLTTPAGLHLGQRTAYDVDLSRLTRVAKRIVKGLFYHKKGFRLPDGYEVRVYAEDADYPEEQASILRRTKEDAMTVVPKTIGNGVFSYWFRSYGEAEDIKDENVSSVVLLFYGRVHFIGVTLPN